MILALATDNVGPRAGDTELSWIGKTDHRVSRRLVDDALRFMAGYQRTRPYAEVSYLYGEVWTFTNRGWIRVWPT